jgi:hypothetical protein
LTGGTGAGGGAACVVVVGAGGLVAVVVLSGTLRGVAGVSFAGSAVPQPMSVNARLPAKPMPRNDVRNLLDFAVPPIVTRLLVSLRRQRAADKRRIVVFRGRVTPELIEGVCVSI